MTVEVRGIDIAYEGTGRGHPLGLLHGHGTGTEDSGTRKGLLRSVSSLSQCANSTWPPRRARDEVLAFQVTPTRHFRKSRIAQARFPLRR